MPCGAEVEYPIQRERKASPVFPGIFSLATHRFLHPDVLSFYAPSIMCGKVSFLVR